MGMFFINKENLKAGILFIFAIDTILLLIFGKTYSKFLLIQPFFHLHDLVLLGLAFISIISFKFNRNRLKSIDLISLASLIYLVYSIVHLEYVNRLNWYYVLRQFMIFGYMIFVYLVLKNTLIDAKFRNYVFRFITFTALLSVVLQFFYVAYLYFFKDINPFFERYYMSPLIVMGLIVSSAFIMVILKKIKRQLLFLLILIISFTVGHDSAFLSLILVYFGYYFSISSVKIKWILVLSFISVLTVIFIWVPTFTDVNMQWRIIYWKAILNEIFVKNYGVLGEGFGIPFLNNETIVELNNLMIQSGHPTNLLTDDENYLTAPHNSFLSLIFHIGSWVLILLIYPFKKCLNQLKKMPEQLFILFLSLVGMSIWSLFNVILELPHSASFYWLIYFTLAIMLKYENKVYE